MRQMTSRRATNSIAVLVFVLVLFMLFTQMRKPEQSGVVPIIRLSNTKISAEEAKQHVRKFMNASLPDLYLYATYRNPSTGRAIHGLSNGVNTFDVDANTGEVFAVSFGNAKYANAGQPTLLQQDALKRAKSFASEHMANFEAFTSNASLTQGFSDGLYRFKWQEKANDEVIGPSFVAVQINGLTGEVAYYQAELHPLEVAVDPVITKREAQQIADKALETSADQLYLEVVFWRGQQVLAWIVNDTESQQSILIDAIKGVTLEG